MSRAVFVSPRDVEKRAHRTITKNRIRNRGDGVEVELSILITVKDPAPIWPRAVRIFDIVLAVGVSFPNVHSGSWDWVPICVLDGTINKKWLAIGVAGYVIAIHLIDCIEAVERPKNTSFSCPGRLWVIDLVDKC